MSLEPRTEAGRRLDAALEEAHGENPDATRAILAIEAEAASPSVEALDWERLSQAIHADQCKNDQPPCPVDEYDARRLAELYRGARLSEDRP